MLRTLKTVLFFAFSALLFNPVSFAQEVDEAKGVDGKQHKETVDGGINYLLEKGFQENGSYSDQQPVAISAMAATALMRNGIPAEHPKIQKTIGFILGFAKADGGIYAEGSNLRNYETCLSLMCLIEANKDNKYDAMINNGVRFIKGIQWDEGEGHAKTSPFYGGFGYGSHERPDMSNAQFAIEVLHAAGVDSSSSVMQNALDFVSKAQNLSSEKNMMPFASNPTADDAGGFIYTPANGGETKVEPPESTTGGLRSYASMTYAGLKSFLYAGLDKDDPRVGAAVGWIQRHYDLESNPGLGPQGLYYYYHVFAKALDAMGERTIVDADKVAHNWRAELVGEMAKRQQTDGSWTNVESDRWMESDKNLATCYAMLALSYCSPESDVETEPAEEAADTKDSVDEKSAGDK